jgi:hypothetical protein
MGWDGQMAVLRNKKEKVVDRERIKLVKSDAPSGYDIITNNNIQIPASYYEVLLWRTILDLKKTIKEERRLRGECEVTS